MSSGGMGSPVPPLHGFVHNTMDALVLFEACLSGILHNVPRRPHDRQRASLIKSGSIFIYEENTSGIKRWTDGLAWSPSRILGNFLIYRELEKPFPPGAKKRAIGRKRTTAPGEPYPRRNFDKSIGADLITPLTPLPPNSAAREARPEISSTDQEKNLERLLVGSLFDSYGFRPDGLVKKIMSVSVNGILLHMVSYYKVEDVKNNLLLRPLSDPRLQNISVRPELYLQQNFRAPVEENEHYAIDCHMHALPQAMYLSMVGGYGIQPGQYVGQPCTSMYGLQASTAASVYGAMAGTPWAMQQASVGSCGNRGYSSQSYTPNHYQPLAGPSAPAVRTESLHTGHYRPY
ncbi:Global transcription regulator sge1 [Elasticomyces elasticus]|nr:Global transcription regulator sge1 [Elasticomyces elasticus]